MLFQVLFTTILSFATLPFPFTSTQPFHLHPSSSILIYIASLSQFLSSSSFSSKSPLPSYLNAPTSFVPLLFYFIFILICLVTFIPLRPFHFHPNSFLHFHSTGCSFTSLLSFIISCPLHFCSISSPLPTAFILFLPALFPSYSLFPTSDCLTHSYPVSTLRWAFLTLLIALSSSYYPLIRIFLTFCW